MTYIIRHVSFKTDVLICNDNYSLQGEFLLKKQQLERTSIIPTNIST